MQNNLSIFSKKIESFFKQKKFDEACIEFRKNDFLVLSVKLLLYKASVIQLAEDAAGYSLDDARNSLLIAVELDSTCIEAWVDLGHFYFAVDDSPDLALTCFEKAHFLLKRVYDDLILGEVKTLLELNKKPEAVAILRSIPQMEVSDGIRVLQNELLK